MENNFNQSPENGNFNNGGFNNQSQMPPKNYLVESILITVLCCLPLGIMGIMNATKVEGLFRAGDHEGAQRAADEAKKYCKFGLIGGGVVIVIYVILMLTGFLAGMSGY